MTDPELVTGAGMAALLPDLLAGFAARRLLVVGSTSGVARAGLTLPGQPARFGGFSPNPHLTDVLDGCRLADAYGPDLVVGIGGGSALDTAKMVRSLPADPAAAIEVLAGRAPPRRRAPLVLVPTTAGTGSEATGFATVYVNGVKHSLDHPSVHADLAVVDPELTRGCPADVAYSGAFDALAHALESLWSLRSTAASRMLASDALTALVAVLGRAAWPLTTSDRADLSTASTRAGLAIDRTRTTAGHAFAYPLTARFGVRHGVACALNLVWLLPYTRARLRTRCQDPRGVAFVARRLAQIGLDGPDLADLLRRTGFSPWLGDHGVAGGDLPGLVAAALGSGRSTNGPVRLDPDDVLPWLRARLAASRRPFPADQGESDAV